MRDLIVLSGSVIHTYDKDLGGATIASVVITGLAVVFIALILLILLVALYGKIFEGINKKAAEKAKAEKIEKLGQEKPKVVKQAEPVAAVSAAENEAEEEVVAVITAAIAAYGEQTGKKLVVKSIKRSEEGANVRSAWSAAGLADATKPF